MSFLLSTFPSKGQNEFRDILSQGLWYVLNLGNLLTPQNKKKGNCAIKVKLRNKVTLCDIKGEKGRSCAICEICKPFYLYMAEIYRFTFLLKITKV